MRTVARRRRLRPTGHLVPCRIRRRHAARRPARGRDRGRGLARLAARGVRLDLGARPGPTPRGRLRDAEPDSHRSGHERSRGHHSPVRPPVPGLHGERGRDLGMRRRCARPDRSGHQRDHRHGPDHGRAERVPARGRRWVPVVPGQRRLRRRHRDRPRHWGQVDQDVPTVRDGRRDGLRVRRAVADHPG